MCVGICINICICIQIHIHILQLYTPKYFLLDVNLILHVVVIMDTFSKMMCGAANFALVFQLVFLNKSKLMRSHEAVYIIYPLVI